MAALTKANSSGEDALSLPVDGSIIIVWQQAKKSKTRTKASWLSCYGSKCYFSLGSLKLTLSNYGSFAYSSVP